MPLPLAVAALLAALLTWFRYLAAIPREQVPRRPVGASMVMGVSVAAALAAPISGFMEGADSVAVGAALGLAPITVVAAGGFLYLLTQAPLPDGELRVSVGDALLPFAATTSEGAPFETSELEGQRFLLKFYRGHW